MASGLTLERVRGDVDVLARAGLDVEDFLTEATTSVGRAVPWVAACLATHDPSTHLLTSARKLGHLREVNSHDHEFGLIEYGTVEPTAFTELAAADVPAAGVQLLHRASGGASGRLEEFMRPHFGFGDEARVIFREGGQAWGAMALFRGEGDTAFDADDVAFLASLSTQFARGVRTGLLARVAEVPAGVGPAGPAVIIVGRDDQVLQLSAGAEQRLRLLSHGELASASDPMSPVSALVGAARRYARGELPHPPRSRVRSRDGMWFVLHASPLSGAGERAGEVVVTIEEARPPEIVALVVAAFGLTPRERDVTQLVLQGVDTKEIAATLHLSAYTVQDHLKSVFEKADVRSRRELIARVYFDQYVPRMGAALSPSGWFAG
jgi:DNA-binding CsgD family transcriptional regulator